MIEVIQSKGIGNYETEAAAEVIAADARFNIWFAENMKRKPEKVERCLEILDAGEALLAECAEAVDAFAAGGQREVLRINLWKIRDQLDELRE